MGNPHFFTSITPEWLTRMIWPKPASQPRCSCGRFCSTHEAPPDMTAKLISELSAKGMHIPARLRPTSPDGRG